MSDKKDEDTMIQAVLKRLFADILVRKQIEKWESSRSSIIDIEQAREECKQVARNYFEQASEFNIDCIDITFDKLGTHANGHLEDYYVQSLEYGNLYSFVATHNDVPSYDRWIYEDFYKSNKGIYYRAVRNSEAPLYLFSSYDDPKPKEEWKLMA